MMFHALISYHRLYYNKKKLKRSLYQESIERFIMKKFVFIYLAHLFVSLLPLTVTVTTT